MKRTPERFSFWKYSLLVMLQLMLLLLGLRVLFPRVWVNQLTAGASAAIGVFLGAHLFNCFIEWAFHRYVLHAVPVAWLRRFAKDHRRHHGLTPICLRREPVGRDLTILNRYPIDNPKQYEAATFPTWALAAFWGLFTPFLVGLQIWLPHTPLLISGYAAVAWSLWCYEIFHHIEHLPYAWWEQRIEHRPFGILWRKAYGFHHLHHANPACNEAVSGFFGLPIADWVFGTYRQPKVLLLDGQSATAGDFAIPPPRRFVRWLDRWVKQREAHRRSHRALVKTGRSCSTIRARR